MHYRHAPVLPLVYGAISLLLLITRVRASQNGDIEARQGPLVDANNAVTIGQYNVSSNLTEPAFFLGVGIAAGLEAQLNLTTATTTAAGGQQSANGNGNDTEVLAVTASGVNAVAEIIGRAVSSFLFLVVNAANGPALPANPALTDLGNATADSVAGALAQNLVNGLTCQAVGGMTALVRDSKIGFAGLNATGIAAANLTNLAFNFSSGGTQFAVNLGDRSVQVNGYSWETMLVLTLVHVGCMVLAFFVIFPSIIILESLGIIHNIVGLGWNEPKVSWWLNLCEVVLYPILILGGLASAAVVVGRGAHFQTTHSRYGLATITLAFICTGLSVARRRMHPSTSISNTEVITNIRRQPVVFASALFTQAVLIFSSFLPINGMDDFSAITLCQYEDLSAATVITAVEYAVALWFGAFGFMTIEFWLLWRLGKLKRPRKLQGADVDISWPLESSESSRQLRRPWQ